MDDHPDTLPPVEPLPAEPGGPEYVDDETCYVCGQPFRTDEWNVSVVMADEGYAHQRCFKP